MARSIGMDNAATFRAAHTILYNGDKEHTYYEGPYGRIGTARARLTFWRNYMKDRSMRAVLTDAWIEKSVSVWQRVD